MLDAAQPTELASLNPDASAARCGRYWAVVHTHPHAERWAAQELRRRGYQAFLPLAAFRRRDRAIPTLWHTVEAPLFSGYVFVVVDGQWTPIRYCPGVHRLLMADNKPGMVPEAAVSALQALEPLPAPQQRWEPGTPCSLVLGPLTGHPAVVLAVAADRARVAIMAFGALREVAVSLEALAPRQ